MREAGHIDCSSALGNLVYETQSLLFISGGVAYLFSGAGGIFVLLRAGSLSEHHFSVALKEYSTLSALKGVRFLQVGSLPRSPERWWSEHLLSLGAQGSERKGGAQRSGHLPSCYSIPFQKKKSRMIKILFLQLSHKCYLKFLFCIPGLNAKCPHNGGSEW